ncbi:hypothetical protein BpHYR1_045698, partial [Brachionus plicatilis]
LSGLSHQKEKEVIISNNIIQLNDHLVYLDCHIKYKKNNNIIQLNDHLVYLYCHIKKKKNNNIIQLNVYNYAKQVVDLSKIRPEHCKAYTERSFNLSGLNNIVQLNDHLVYLDCHIKKKKK